MIFNQSINQSINQSGSKPQHSVVVEVVDPFTWALASISNTYKVLHNLHMLWMCAYMSPHHITAALVIQKLPRILVFSWGVNYSTVLYLRLYTHSSRLPHQYQTHMVFHNLHMFLMWMWMSHHPISAALVSQDLKASWDSVYILPPEGQTTTQCSTSQE